MSIQQMLFAGGGVQVINVNMNVTQTTPYNLFVAIGSPANPVEVNLTVSADCQAGIVQGSGWAAGSTCKIINNAGIYGEAGGGGSGGSASYYNVNLKFWTDGSYGGTGGDALSLSIPTTIDNTSGNIFGGGGGGGGGSASSNVQPSSWMESTLRAGGGGGGGGQGYNNAAGGAGGDTYPFNWQGSSGGSGSGGGAGSGGAGGVAGILQVVGGAGGAGGTWGQDGNFGSSGSATQNTNPGGGGSAGYAIRQNGNSLTWLGGNNASQVKGNVG